MSVCKFEELLHPTGEVAGAGSLEEGFRRMLIHIPIVHGETDMGAPGRPVHRTAIGMMGVGAWKRGSHFVDALWDGIERSVERLGLCYESVRLYQEGLPVCGCELEIVEELASRGSLNHRLLLRLVGKGATLMGTESAQLLVEEYAFAKEAVDVRHRGRMLFARPFGNPPGGSLLERRERFIAARINATLGEGETGVLFLGMLHSLDDLLGKDIQVVCATGPPSHREGKNENE